MGEALLHFALCLHVQSLCKYSVLNAEELQIGVDYTSKTSGVWAEGYHKALYNLTDDAIRGALTCPSDTPESQYALCFLRYTGKA